MQYEYWRCVCEARFVHQTDGRNVAALPSFTCGYAETMLFVGHKEEYIDAHNVIYLIFLIRTIHNFNQNIIFYSLELIFFTSHDTIIEKVLIVVIN